MKTLSLVLTAMLAAQTGCAGALYTEGDGDAVLPISFGNSEFTSGEGWSCASGGPISGGLVELVVESVRMALSILLPGAAAGESDVDNDSERQAGCLERGPAAAPNVAEEPEQ